MNESINISKNINNLSKHDKDEENEKNEIRKFFNQIKNGVCIEVGSNEPNSLCSQSLHLEQKLNWQCVLIEPNPSLARKAIKNRPKAIVCEVACTFPNNMEKLILNIPLDDNNIEITGHASLEKNADEHNYHNHNSIEVKTDTLTNILQSKKINNIDFLSIDVEGTELDVLLGLDFNLYQPRLILLEDKHLYLKKHFILKQNGYKLVQRLNRNSWYIPKDLKFKSTSLKRKIKLFKRMYISIWFKKIHYSLRHKTFAPFKTL
jgi:FkbM family methyltransferase